jgi:hypothetical protein
MELSVLAVRLLVPQCSLEAEERNEGDSLRRTCVRCRVPRVPYRNGDDYTPETIRRGLIPLRTAI